MLLFPITFQYGLIGTLGVLTSQVTTLPHHVLGREPPPHQHPRVFQLAVPESEPCEDFLGEKHPQAETLANLWL